MKMFYFAALLMAVVITRAAAENDSFDGLEKVMDPAIYEQAGLSKLTKDERSVLDRFIKDYLSGKQREAATTAAAEAVDRAVREQKVRPPEVIESNIVGTYKGYGLKTVFHLANGEKWKPTNDDIVSSLAVENPKVIIYRDTFGYKMFVEGATTIRVKRVQ